MNSKRLHDLKTVYTNFQMVYHLLQENHPLDEKEKQDILHQLKHSLEVFKKEIVHSEKLFVSLSSSNENQKDKK